jgi:hypothetical protein
MEIASTVFGLGFSTSSFLKTAKGLRPTPPLWLALSRKQFSSLQSKGRSFSSKATSLTSQFLNSSDRSHSQVESHPRNGKGPCGTGRRSAMAFILVVEDEEQLRALIARILKAVKSFRPNQSRKLFVSARRGLLIW